MVTTLTQGHIDDFHSWLTARGLADETLRAYTTDIKEFLNLMAPVTLETFDQKAVLWLNGNRKTWAPKTTGRRMTALRTFARRNRLQAEVLFEYKAPDPGRPVPHPIPEGIPGVVRMIGAAKNPRQRALIALCGLCGLRLSEALTITPSSFDVRARMVTVRGKGDKTRTVPVSTTAWDYISEAWMDAGAVSLSQPVVAYKDRFAREIVTACGRRAGLSRPVSSHDLRATFATAVYDKTLDIRTTQELLGHASSKTTEGYTEVKANAMRDAVELTGP